MVQQRPTSGQICGNQATVEKTRRKEITVLWKGTVSMGRATELRSCRVTEEADAVSCSPSSPRMLTLPVLCLWPLAIPFQGSFRLVGILRICPAIQILCLWVEWAKWNISGKDFKLQAVNPRTVASWVSFKPYPGLLKHILSATAQVEKFMSCSVIHSSLDN